MTTTDTTPEPRWYAMRVFNNRILRTKEELEARGARTYNARDRKRPQRRPHGTAGPLAALRPLDA